MNKVIHRLVHSMNKVTGNCNVKKRNELPWAKQGWKVTSNYPLSIEGVVTLLRYPCREFSCLLTYTHKPFRV